MLYSTLIFDLDGTLYKTDALFMDALIEIGRTRGLEIQSQEDIKSLIGEPSIILYRKLFGPLLSEDELIAIRNEVKQYEEQHFEEKAKLFYGIKGLIVQLNSEGYQLCICSNGSKEYVEKVLNFFGLKQYFSIIKSWTKEFNKDNQVKQILDECKTDKAIVIGDTKQDMTSSKINNCISIGVTYGYGKEGIQSADFTVSTAEQIHHVIQKINFFYTDISKRLVSKKQEDKPLIVGINGVDASGKTTFTKELNQYLITNGYKTQVIHLDDFHNPSPIRYQAPDPIYSYIHHAFDLSRIENELLKPIKNEKELHKELVLLNLEEDTYTNYKSFDIDQDTIVLFEGVLLFREPIDSYFDMRIYIDISFEEVLKRVIKRDSHLFGDKVIERYNNKYIPIQKIYIEEYQPIEKCDLVIDNSDYYRPNVLKKS